ncbi:MAG: hypothetical protein AAB584_00065 [Patescibacteria group bacterium]
MLTTAITPDKLKSIIKDSLREVLALELMKLRADLVPYVSSREQKEIEKKYGKPSRKTEKSVEIEL